MHRHTKKLTAALCALLAMVFSATTVLTANAAEATYRPYTNVTKWEGDLHLDLIVNDIHSQVSVRSYARPSGTCTASQDFQSITDKSSDAGTACFANVKTVRPIASNGDYIWYKV
ncbi:hypothetical protein CQR55_0717 [Bifidobacterium pseudolongum subsp. globosum]|uniref:Uncharacterized protein n=1 Tax=Bifidobacterium pseudolongum subsp. globosum TaxID=1690 RepID=A0A2N3QY96_9BIFI|nr:hypothetical protein [Bifidobacterium pseudolongum]PKU96934.1 hypothetical protein CQR55_0717 [Bifidobacterium pseudolongum subsp. globosum]PKU98093.1 hypothetical protein CQR56_0455 [Bifidobacterium pseudolongum subsp. globosum]PKV03342.1 hypothetical protein CQR53_0883 [Bifidobacterium pseudolongum subsp. globosum]RYQ44623.1 hypothetical protein PG1791B_0741 [Bifidobacterium pseudolongum subsp. globosum]RYQ58489.1 hypothetical protein PG1616B_0712 [Bifidobacterium pseudolongum subsp. glob